MTTDQTVIVLVSGELENWDDLFEWPRFRETSPCRVTVAADQQQLADAIADPSVQLVVMELTTFGPEMLETLADCPPKPPMTGAESETVEQSPTAGLPPPPFEADAASESGRILLIEDEDDVRDYFRSLLEGEGHQVSVADTLDAARTVVAERQAAFDIVVADIVLPDGNSVGLVEELRQMMPWVEVVFISGYAPELFVDPEQMRLEQAEFIPKPLDGGRLLSTIDTLLAGR